MSTVAFIEAMVADGWSIEDAVRAARTFERVVTPQRSKGAERQARYRERHQASHTVTSDASDACDTRDDLPPTSPPPSPEPPTTPTPTPVDITTRARKAATKRCPEGWTPTSADLEVGEGKGLTPAEIAAAFERFRDHTFGTARSDWSATFRNWLRETADRKSRTQFKPRQANDPQPSRGDQILDRYFEASERAVARGAFD